MSIITKLRRGQGPVWGPLKRIAKKTLAFHLPVNAVTRPMWRGLYGLHVTTREAWIWARRFFWNEPLFRSLCESVGSGFQMEELPYVVGEGRIVVGKGVRLSGKPSFAFNNRHGHKPTVSVGDSTFIGHACSFRVGQSITIGSHCLLAGGVSISDYDGHPVDAVARRRGDTSPAGDMRPVTIGNDVWIGAGALILKGISIGERAIVGAHAVVTKDVPADCIVAGNPARIVKSLAEREFAELSR